LHFFDGNSSGHFRYCISKHRISGGNYGALHWVLQCLCAHQRDWNRQDTNRWISVQHGPTPKHQRAPRHKMSTPAEDKKIGHHIHSLTPSDPAHCWTQALGILRKETWIFKQGVRRGTVWAARFQHVQSYISWSKIEHCFPRLFAESTTCRQQVWRFYSIESSIEH